MPKLSIILPVYNVDDYLENCLETLENFCNQVKDVELIIVNDGSTDTSLDIISNFLDYNPDTIFVSQVNQGLSSARNVGLKHATGNYIWFIDSDDKIKPDIAVSLYEKIEIFDKYDIIAFGRCEVYKDFSLLNPIDLVDKIYESGDIFLNETISCGIFRTNVWDKWFSLSFLKHYNIYFEEGLLYEDMLFCFSTFHQAAKVRLFPLYPYVYNCSNNSSITKKIRVKDLDVLIHIKKAADYYLKYKGELKESVFYQLIFNWTCSCLMNKYVSKSFYSKDAKVLMRKVQKDRTFRDSAYYCSKNTGIRFRIKFSAKLILNSLTLYQYYLYIALQFQKKINKIIFHD